MAPQIYNLRNFRGIKLPEHITRVDRLTKFGNPFPMDGERNRDLVCDRFEEWIARPEQAALVQAIKAELRGKDLACWCAPKRCHAETIRRIANE